MAREEKEQIIILKTYPVGENHRGVKLLTPGNGVLNALVYGGNGKNSSKKGAIIPFCYGWGELVHHQSRGRYQLKEFAVEAGFSPVREDLRKTYAASLWTEVILGSYGGGHHGPELFLLFLESLHALAELGAEEDLSPVMVRFLWSYLALSGERPDPSRCSHCARSTEGGIYRDSRGRIFCSACAHGGQGRLPAAIVPYLARVDRTDWEAFRKIGVASRTMEQLKRWLYAVIQDHMEYPLKTLKTGSFLL
ncbi:MAG: DNA repair protein RecO [Spirochaetales bacterium]|nr:DNA repair protein RecO [Spirochaetales bacterium]